MTMNVTLILLQGRAVHTAQALDEGHKSVISLDNIEVIFDHNNGKLVHLISPLRTDKVSIIFYTYLELSIVNYCILQQEILNKLIYK